MSLTTEEAEKIIAAVRACVSPPSASAPRHVPKPNGAVEKVAPPPTPSSDGEGDDFDSSEERRYQRFKRRFIDEAQVDPTLVRLMMIQPEMVVEVERQVVTLEGSTLKGRTARLFAQGWFKEPRATSAARYELAKTGGDPGGGGALNDVLVSFRNMGFLSKDASGRWLATPGVKVTEKHIATKGGE